MSEGEIAFITILGIGVCLLIYGFYISTDENGCSFQKSFRKFRDERQNRREE